MEHELIVRYGPFLGHALHIFTEINHLAAFAVLGLLVGRHEGAARSDGMFSFALALVAGMFAPQAWTAWGAFTAIEKLVSAGGIAGVGLLVVLGKRLPSLPLALIGALTGAIHGIASGLVVSESAQWLVSTGGALLAGLSIAVAGLVLAGNLNSDGRRRFVRLVGGGAVALGLVLIGLSAQAVRGP